MALTNSDKKNLDELFKNVGFEGFSTEEQDQEAPEEAAETFEDKEEQNQEDIEEAAETFEDKNSKGSNELDPEIAALLGGISADQSEEPLDDEDNEEDFDSLANLEGATAESEEENEDEEEVPAYYFLEEESSKISPRLRSRIKQQKEEDIIPVENNTLPKDLRFNFSYQEDLILSLVKNLGEITEQPQEETTAVYLEEEKAKSRLMSRVKQHEEKEFIPVQNNTLPENLYFNFALSSDKITEFISGLGELTEAIKKEEEVSYLEEEKKNTRLMSRIKQREVKEFVAVDNNTIPQKLLFNFNMPEKKIKSILKSIGD